MTLEEKISQDLSSKFNLAPEAIKIPRPRRISVEVSVENFLTVFEYIAKHLGFGHLCTITGLDEQDKITCIYHLANDNGILINLKKSVSKENPVIKSVIHQFPGAEIYERELVDLLGVKVEGLPEGNRYPLTDDWPKGEYPLRKDWKNKDEVPNA